jgi:hypothetical protein
LRIYFSADPQQHVEKLSQLKEMGATAIAQVR